MSLLNRLSTGRILEDDFTSTTLNEMWQPSPSDPSRYSLTENPGYLRLKHGDIPLYILMDLPNRDFVFEIKNTYNPTKEDDTGGIIVFRDESHFVQLLEYFDAEKGVGLNFTHMRMVRTGSLYSGYGSKDGGLTWQLIGTTTSDTVNKIGLVLNNNPVGGVPLDIDYVKVYSDRRILIGNLAPGMQIDLLKSDGTKVASKKCPVGADHIYIDMTNLPAPFYGKIRVWNASGVLKETSDNMNIWGGDVFWYGLVVEVYKDNNLLPKDVETELGPMMSGSIEVKLIVKNPSIAPIYNTLISVKKFHEFHGYEWAHVAEDLGGTPGEYDYSLNLGTLYAGEERTIWLKVSKQFTNDFAMAGEHKFYLEVTN